MGMQENYSFACYDNSRENESMYISDIYLS